MFLRERFLSLRPFRGLDAIEDGCCDASNRLSAGSGRIASLTNGPDTPQHCRIEGEADRRAAWLMGSVAGLLAAEEGRRSNPDTPLNWLILWVGGYPRRRPWLARMAAQRPGAVN